MTLPAMEPAGAGSAAGGVTIEAVAWVTRFVGGNGTSRVRLREPLEPGDTVRSVLHRCSQRFPKLREALWDRRTGELAEHIEVMVNNAALGLRATLDSPVSANDTITLLGQFMGG